PCIFCPGMSVKVGLCLIHLSSTGKTMRNRLAKPYYTLSWSKDGSSRPMRSSVVELGVQRFMSLRDILSFLSRTITCLGQCKWGPLDNLKRALPHIWGILLA